MHKISNLWQHSSREAVSTPQLGQNLDVDLVVIGGGFTGNSAAIEARAQGASVAVLEAETFGHGGSGRNVGLVNAGLWLPPEDVVKEMGAAPAKRLIDALAAAPRLVWDLIAQYNIECEATPNGTLHLAHAASGLRDLQARHAQGVARGWPLQLLDAAETARRTGSSAFHGALLDPRAGTIQPRAYVQGLARAALAAGAQLYQGTKVSHVEHKNGLWHVSANGHTVRAKSLLLATNAYFEGIDMGFKPEIVAVSYFQMATKPMTAAQRATVLPQGEGCWDTALVMSSFRTDKAGRLLIGAIGNLEGPSGPVHDAWARRKLAKVYPQLAKLEFEHAWRGRIAMTNDHIPKIVGFGPSAYACFGYSGRGIGPGTVFGKSAARALLTWDESHLPVASVGKHSETAAPVKEAWFEAGAAATHLINPLPLT